MSSLLARLARTLTHHWKRSLAAALVVLFLLGIAAGTGSPAADDFEIPGTESQQALDLFRAHSPAFAGADADLVFTVEDGKITDPEPKAAIAGALEKVSKLKGVDQVPDPFASDSGSISPDGRLASVSVRYTTEPADLEKEDGEALLDDRRRLRADVPGRGARRHRDRDRAADPALPLGLRDGRHARRGADRRRRRPDAADGARVAARAAGV